MASVGAYHAKTHLAALLDRVENGERITITRHGQPVAELIPVGAGPRLTPSEAIHRIQEARRGRSLGGISLRELIDEGRHP